MQNFDFSLLLLMIGIEADSLCFCHIAKLVLVCDERIKRFDTGIGWAWIFGALITVFYVVVSHATFGNGAGLITNTAPTSGTVIVQVHGA